MGTLGIPLAHVKVRAQLGGGSFIDNLREIFPMVGWNIAHTILVPSFL